MFERAYLMRLHRGRVRLFSAALGATLASVSCSGQSAPTSPRPQLLNAGFALVTPGTLTVAIPASVAPPAMTITGTTLGGVDGALINAFVRDHQLKIRLYPTTTFASTVLAVQSGRADLGAG